MIVAVVVMLVLGTALLGGFVGCDYRGPSDVDPDPPSPLLSPSPLP